MTDKSPGPPTRSEASASDSANPPVPAGPAATELAGFGAPGLLWMAGILAGYVLFHPLGAVLVLAWARRSRTPWRAIGFVPEPNWALSIVGGGAFGVAFKLLLKSIAMPLLGAPPINGAYHYLAGNRAALPGAILTLVVAAGFAEETLFRGYFFERLGRLLGSGGGAKLGIVVLTAVLFGMAHLADQGLPGAEQATITGLAFGTIFALTGRIAVPMIAHAAFDLTALAIIYGNLETRVAHLFFR